MTLAQTLAAWQPGTRQEAADKALVLAAMGQSDVTTRANPVCHLTASAWVTNPARDKVLMAYHNIYGSWAWTGGHADGETDLLAVALREVREETGAAAAPLAREIFSLEVLPVPAHDKRGARIAPHLHLNVTYLLCADDAAPLRVKTDENSAVQWFSLDEAVTASTEPDMRQVYQKLNDRLRRSVTVTVDRPLGSRHPKHPGMVYPVNYGFVAGVQGGDGEAQDAYILGPTAPCAAFTGRRAAVLHRADDCETKWVVCPFGTAFSAAEILQATAFTEQYFKTTVEMDAP